MPTNTVKVDRTTKRGNPFIVGRHGTLWEATPQFERQLNEFRRTNITVVVRRSTLEAEVLRGPVPHRRHDVPSRAPAADVVQGGQAPREVEGIRIRGGCGPNEADVLGRGANDGKEHGGLE